MDESNIVVLNCCDEKLHYIGNSSTVVKYRHGNISVQGNDTMSFSLVFNYYSDTMISTINSYNTKEKIKHDARTKLYEACDKHHHHALLKKYT